MTFTESTEATVNFIKNPGFHAATTSWTTSGTNTIARVVNSTEGIAALPSDLDDFVLSSLKCVYGSVASMAVNLPTVDAAGPHSLSAYIYLPTGMSFATLTLRTVNFTGATGTQTVNANLGLLDQWQQLTLPNIGIVSGDLIGQVQLFWQSTTPTAGSTAYIAAVMLEPLAAVTSYADGTMGERYSWRGTANNSVSDRVAGSTGVGAGAFASLVGAASGLQTITGTGASAFTALVGAAVGSQTVTGVGAGVFTALVGSGSGTQTGTGAEGVMSGFLAAVLSA